MDVGKLESFAKMVVNNATNLYILRGAAVDEVFFTMEHVYEFIGGHSTNGRPHRLKKTQ